MYDDEYELPLVLVALRLLTSLHDDDEEEDEEEGLSSASDVLVLLSASSPASPARSWSSASASVLAPFSSSRRSPFRTARLCATVPARTPPSCALPLLFLAFFRGGGCCCCCGCLVGFCCFFSASFLGFGLLLVLLLRGSGAADVTPTMVPSRACCAVSPFQNCRVRSTVRPLRVRCVPSLIAGGCFSHEFCSLFLSSLFVLFAVFFSPFSLRVITEGRKEGCQGELWRSETTWTSSCSG